MSRASLLLPVVIATIALAGCPPPPPFSAAGTYTGNWTGTETNTPPNKQGQEVTACPITLTLTQNPGQGGLGAYSVQGTATIDYSCIELPEWLDEIPASTIQVSGVMNEQGRVILASAGCGTGLCLALALNGPGLDTDNDGLMDSYSGEWSYRILLAGVAPFGFDGTFDVQRQ